MEKKRSIYFNVRYSYILVYVVFTALNKFISFAYVDNSIISAIYNALALFGAALLAVDAFTKRNALRVRYNGLLLAFFGAYVLSMLYNWKFGWTDNAKTLVWMLIQTLLLTAADPQGSFESHQRYLRIIFDCFLALWLVGVVISLGQYATLYHMPHVMPNGDKTPEGFAEGRLFGVFTDPNVAAVCSIIAIVLAVYQMRYRTCGRWVKLCYGISIVANVIYVILSGSRTGEMILLALVMLGTAFFCLCRESKGGTRWYVKAGQSATLIILSAALLVGGINVSRAGLSYVPGLYDRAELLWQIVTGDESVSPDDREELDGSLDHIELERPDVVDNDDISNSRFKIWTDALKLFKLSPILGTSARNHLAFAEHYFGKDMYMVRRQYSVHNGYLSLLVFTGVLGAAVMVAWMSCIVVYVLGYLLRRRKSTDPYYGQILCLTMALVAIAISAFPMSGIFFGNSVIEVLFWLILGEVLYLIRCSEGATGEPKSYLMAEKLMKKLTRRGS